MSKRENKSIEELDDELELFEQTGQEDAEVQEEELQESSKSRRRKVMTSLLNNEGEGNVTNFKDLLKSIDLNGEWFRKNLLFIFLVTASLLLFVTNRYQAQQEQIEEARLKTQLAEMKYKWLTRFSELTTSTRQSQIEEQLKENGDTELRHSKKPPILITTRK